MLYDILCASAFSLRSAVTRNAERTTLALALPGRTSADVSVTVDGTLVRVQAPRKEVNGFALPAVDTAADFGRAAESVSATMKDGVLYLASERVKPRAVPVAA